MLTGGEILIAKSVFRKVMQEFCLCQQKFENKFLFFILKKMILYVVLLVIYIGFAGFLNDTARNKVIKSVSVRMKIQN